MRRKMTIEHVQEIARQRGGKCLSTVYVNNQTKLTFECARMHRWDATTSSVINKGSWCPFCWSARFKTGRGKRVQSAFTMDESVKEHIDKATACKIVICDPSDAYFKMLEREFDVVLFDNYNAVKNEFLKKYNCGNHVNPKILAATAFYLLSKNKGFFFSQNSIARLLRTSDVSIRNFMKKMERCVSKQTWGMPVAVKTNLE